MSIDARSVQAFEAEATIETGTYDKALSMLAQSFGPVPRLISVHRTRLIKKIYKYSFIFKVGDGEFDKIGVYRVVKESRPWVPIRAEKGVMMTHAFISDFESVYLTSTLPGMPPKIRQDHCLGVYLAEDDIDVWGTDRRSTFVPDYYCDEYDCSFMKDWDFGRSLQDLKLAVKFARIIRGLTGSGWGKIFILGHSVGGDYAYAYANEETQIPKWSRDLKGIILLDTLHEFDPGDEEQIANAQARYEAYEQLYEAGIYYDDTAVVLKDIAWLAATDPEGYADPPIIPGLNNKEVGLFTLSALYLTLDYWDLPLEHYCSGTFDYEGLDLDPWYAHAFTINGLRYTNFDYMLGFATLVPSFDSLAERIDRERRLWGDDDYPYDDHLGEIEIPVFYVGAAGAGGEWGAYTLALLESSTDKQSIIVNPGDLDTHLAYGHIDVVFADNADTLVWQPILEWINSH